MRVDVKKGEVNTIEYLAYGNYNHYANRRSGLSGTKETLSGSNEGYQIIKPHV